MCNNIYIKVCRNHQHQSRSHVDVNMLRVFVSSNQLFFFSFVCGLCVFLYVSRKKGESGKKKGLCVVKSRGWEFGVQPAVNISLFYIAELNYAHNLTRESLYDVYIWVLFFILSSGNQVPDLSSYFLSLFSFFYSQNEESNVSLLFVWFASVFSRLPWASLMTPPSFFFSSFIFYQNRKRDQVLGILFDWKAFEEFRQVNVDPFADPESIRENGSRMQFFIQTTSIWGDDVPLLVLSYRFVFICFLHAASVRAGGGGRWRSFNVVHTCQHRFGAIILYPLTCRDDRYIFTEITVKCFIVTCHEIINPLVEMTSSLFRHFSCVIF
jgi:hypothetical protein